MDGGKELLDFLMTTTTSDPIVLQLAGWLAGFLSHDTLAFLLFLLTRIKVPTSLLNIMYKENMLVGMCLMSLSALLCSAPPSRGIGSE